MRRIGACGIVLLLLISHAAFATDYYMHPVYGDDTNDGLSRKKAIKTLEKASTLRLLPGDRLLLAGGQTFYGSLRLQQLQGTSDRPIVVKTVKWKASDPAQPAIIDARGVQQGILVEDCAHLKISFIHVTGNGYKVKDTTSSMRTGVLLQPSASDMKYITLEGLKVYDVFYENPGFRRGEDEVRTANGTQSYGWGIRVISQQGGRTVEDIRILDCEIENVGHTGIKLTGSNKNIKRVRIERCKVSRTGGPGIQMSHVVFAYVGGNEVIRSGSDDDSRKWGRGSGLWTWSCSSILIEKNKFMYANGPGDSAGAHIDFNCDHVVLQYNLSAHNAGGFCEILGNNYNCAYRYNISVNDGHRVKGQDGAFQEGKTFWLSGYQGNQKERKGPVNTYFYNNTIFVDESIVSKVAIENRSEGILIANNIFYVMGASAHVKGDQYKADDGRGTIKDVFFRNNLFLRAGNWPEAAIIHDEAPLFGDPGFHKPGGLSLTDYIPSNETLTRSGIPIPYLPGDKFGLLQGLEVKEDILGNPVGQQPGIGAIAVPASVD